MLELLKKNSPIIHDLVKGWVEYNQRLNEFFPF